MDRFDDDTLLAELRELRPTPRPEFTADLDQRAAAGFPRGADMTAAVFAPLLDWWRGLKPARRLMPALGFALVAVVVATAAVAISQSGNGSGSGNAAEDASLGAATSAPSIGAEAGAIGGAAEVPGAGKTHHGPSHASGGALLPQYEAEASESFGSEAGAAGEAGSETETEAPPTEKAPATKSAEHRDVERSSYVVLGTKPGEVSDAAAKVYEAVHAAGGFVLSSSVRSGTAGATGASFELSIPSARVGSALAAISSIAEVRERHDATDDITAPTVSAAEELADSNAAIDGLLKQLADTETEAERESVEARLREERRRHAAIRASLDHLHLRASMSEVTVRIVTKNGAGVTPPAKGDGDWGVGDALHDAGHILTIAAGVVLVGLAVLAPFALIALLAWAANRFRVRRLRERALG
ncbi:MAG TPA: DUF4349 domain-containing protein [Solirubrobacterales bacterium]|nr:DUF4349 domain-containing protein [Solirubrobacterales bacterium]